MREWKRKNDSTCEGGGTNEEYIMDQNAW